MHLGVVQTGSACPVILIPAPRSCPCGERKGFKRKERVGAAAGVVRSAAYGLTKGQEGVRGRSGVRDREAWACVTERHGRLDAHFCPNVPALVPIWN